jgi:lipoprotein-anchoring transpeptidase ErfK/SrfK
VLARTRCGESWYRVQLPVRPNGATGWVRSSIHGTNRPDLLGSAVSNGCIGVRNDVLLRMWELAPGGTPVSIHV